MLVQDEKDPKPQIQIIKKKNSKTIISENPQFTEPQNLGFLRKWVLSLNPLKLVAIFFLALTVGALFFLLRTSATSDESSAAFFCFKSRSKKVLTPTKPPKIDFDSIKPNPDKTSIYSSFTMDRWIVVSVSDHPSDALRRLTRVKGWQVLAIGNSKTPKDWSLKGTIFLSLEDQASLNYRVSDFLPFDSHLRKTVGYLFAVQHGATAIFDADDRAEVIGGDLGKHFDLKLRSSGSNQERILQYNVRSNPNRTVVNPYIHFGQRSVWPRGLPLESVGSIQHEEYYDEVFGGTQFIQQGLSNGLPDVDSLFYFTRKLGFEKFDIRFDEHAPKVSVPRGLMVPVNSVNTLFHISAFWGLVLPVSVGPAASDSIRGYWAQRLLWEIGGSVVVYPPTIHRDDEIGRPTFADEKDLHVNANRLIDFLLKWQSESNSKKNNKDRVFFDKVSDLSFEMVREGFWTERDLKLTKAWLEDLVSVGYREPERVEGRIGISKEFVPRKLPSVHLGVSESETVNYEIGNLVRWKKRFGDVVLIVFVSFESVEGTALEWKLLYGRIFKAVVILSEKANPDLAVEEASMDQLYKYLPKIFERFDSAEGFLFLKDSTILNYWNLHQADKSKLWITNKVPKSWITVSINDKDSKWFLRQAKMVKKVVSTMPVHFQVSYKSSVVSDQTLTTCNSEVFYVPRCFVTDFVDLVGLVGDSKIHHKVAVPMFFTAMDLPQQFDPVFSKMVHKPEALSGNYSSSNFYSAKAPAVYPWTVKNEVDFLKLIRLMESGDPLLMELI